MFYKGHEEEDSAFLEIELKWKNKEISTLNLIGHSWGGQAVINLTKRLHDANIPVTELITLDPVALTPYFCPIKNFTHWVNIYQSQSILDAVATIPVAGNTLAGVGSLIRAIFPGHSLNDTIATLGGQLGSQQGATTISCGLDHADAWGMYQLAQKQLEIIQSDKK